MALYVVTTHPVRNEAPCISKSSSLSQFNRIHTIMSVLSVGYPPSFVDSFGFRLIGYQIAEVPLLSLDYLFPYPLQNPDLKLRAFSSLSECQMLESDT